MEELFTRLFYHGTVQMGMDSEAFWLMPMGRFMDLWACHKQYLGLEEPYKEITVDDVIPVDL